jgi:protocatechuate 3,4-dioxygenase beta subunit
MERKHFLKNGLAALGLAAIAPLANACKKDTSDGSSDSSSSSGTDSSSGSGSSGSGSCTATSSETEGPFPTKSPSTLVKSDIKGDRTGVAFTIKIYIKNKNNSCAALSGALVDIWHCDKDGYYSEYGGTSMQTVDYTAVHFLRGRQTTDSDGLVTFTSIFPGWYTSRATHIHVHIYNSSGTSLLVTQIAFPEGSDSAVATVNGSGGTAYGYTKGMTGYTYNASDNVFSDSVSNELAGSVSGSLSGGYTLTHTIYVAA